jgi:hypothetical protein
MKAVAGKQVTKLRFMQALFPEITSQRKNCQFQRLAELLLREIWFRVVVRAAEGRCVADTHAQE